MEVGSRWGRRDIIESVQVKYRWAERWRSVEETRGVSSCIAAIDLRGVGV